VKLGTIPRQLNVVQTSHYYMLITFVLQLHFYLGRGLPDGLFPSMFPTKYIYFSFFPMLNVRHCVLQFNVIICNIIVLWEG